MNCAACRFSMPNIALFGGWRECHRYPPGWFARRDGTRERMWMHVRDSEWCGEFEGEVVKETK